MYPTTNTQPLIEEARPNVAEQYHVTLFFVEKLGTLIKSTGECALWELMSDYLSNKGFSSISPTYIAGTGTIPACAELVRGLLVYTIDYYFKFKEKPELYTYLKESTVKTIEYFLSSAIVNAAWSPLYVIAQTLGFSATSTIFWVGGLSAIACFFSILFIRGLCKLTCSPDYSAKRLTKDKFIESFKYSFFEVSAISGAFVLQMPDYPIASWIPQLGYTRTIESSALLGVAGQSIGWTMRTIVWCLQYLWTNYGRSLAEHVWKEINCAPLTEIICKY